MKFYPNGCRAAHMPLGEVIKFENAKSLNSVCYMLARKYHVSAWPGEYIAVQPRGKRKWWLFKIGEDYFDGTKMIMSHQDLDVIRAVAALEG